MIQAYHATALPQQLVAASRCGRGQCLCCSVHHFLDFCGSVSLLEIRFADSAGRHHTSHLASRSKNLMYSLPGGFEGRSGSLHEHL